MKDHIGDYDRDTMNEASTLEVTTGGSLVPAMWET